MNERLPRTCYKEAVECERLFKEYLERISKVTNRSEKSDDLDRSVKLYAQVQIEFGRFNSWTSNEGALTPGHASLDYRLRDAERLRDPIIETLLTLQAQTKLCSENITETLQIGINLYASVDLEIVRDIIAMLHKSSITISRASKDSQSRREIVEFEFDDAQEFRDNFAFGLIQRKFPGATSIIQKRLASAMLLRRRRFLYRQDRHDRPSAIHRTLDSDIYAYVPKPVLVNHERRAETQVPYMTSAPTAGPSITSATTTESTSYPKASAAPTVSWEKIFRGSWVRELDFPPMPATQRGRDTKCPYCYVTLRSDLLNEARWREHVKGDLDAYVCLFEQCEDPGRLYEHKNDWLQHMRLSHMRKYRCPAKRHGPLLFETAEELAAHVANAHSDIIPPQRMSRVMERSVCAPGTMFHSCPLCGLSNETETQLEDHIEVHLRFLALKCLPFPSDTAERNLPDISSGVLGAGTMSVDHQDDVPPLHSPSNDAKQSSKIPAMQPSIRTSDYNEANDQGDLYPSGLPERVYDSDVPDTSEESCQEDWQLVREELRNKEPVKAETTQEYVMNTLRDFRRFFI